MDFLIRKATEADINGIMRIMNSAAKTTEKEDWFVSDTEEMVRDHLDHKGYIIVAEAENQEIAGFFLVKEPAPDENLGTYLGFSREQLEQVLIMDSAAVAPEYRGNQLQSRMLVEAEKYIDRERFVYLMCTVHPKNRYSLQNMLRHGYEIMATRECYGGYIRNILLKNVISL